MRTERDRRLLERTVAVARRSKAFEARKVPKTLRVAFDASALEGAGRVEDTINLLAHAARNVLTCAADLLDRTVDDIQLSRMTLPLAEPAKRIEGGRCHLVVERHHDNPGILQQFFE